MMLVIGIIGVVFLIVAIVLVFISMMIETKVGYSVKVYRLETTSMLCSFLAFVFEAICFAGVLVSVFASSH